MEEVRLEGSSARARRALALIAIALVVLASSAGVYLWRSKAGVAPPKPAPSGSAPGLVELTPLSEREAWVILRDGAAPRSVLLHTADGGASWRSMLSIDGFGSLRFTDPRRGVLVSWRPGSEGKPLGVSQVFSTDDGGAHWRPANLPDVGAGFAGIPFYLDPDHGWLLAARARVAGDQSAQDFTLWRTVDGGRRWESLFSIDGSHPFSHGVSGADQLVSVSFQDRDTGWIVTQGTAASAVVYASHDGGRQWEPIPLPAGLPGPGREDYLYLGDPVVSPGGRGVLPVVDRDANRTWLYQTVDGGRAWTNPYFSPGTGVLTLMFVDGSVGWATESAATRVTSDSGQSWLPGTALPGGLLFGVVAPVSDSVAWAQGLQFDPGSVAPARWAMFRTHDAGLHWTRLTQPGLP
jgi:photosystem II stability/assembly factor-like uncharacterized protein